MRMVAFPFLPQFIPGKENQQMLRSLCQFITRKLKEILTFLTHFLCLTIWILILVEEADPINAFLAIKKWNIHATSWRMQKLGLGRLLGHLVSLPSRGTTSTYSNSRNNSVTPSFFHKCATPFSNPLRPPVKSMCQRLKHRKLLSRGRCCIFMVELLNYVEKKALHHYCTFS